LRNKSSGKPDRIFGIRAAGSGEIESAHRHIVQRRLKLPGAWWRAANADHMLSLRLNRANQQWNEYWAADFKQAA
ncbi:MAG: hypothetical protein ACYDDT_06405, partial [Sulfuricella sp.]